MKQFCSKLGLPLPEKLPNEVQEMLKKCYEKKAKEKPSFNQIWKQFSFLNVIWQLDRFFFLKRHITVFHVKVLKAVICFVFCKIIFRRRLLLPTILEQWSVWKIWRNLMEWNMSAVEQICKCGNRTWKKRNGCTGRAGNKKN